MNSLNSIIIKGDSSTLYIRDVSGLEFKTKYQPVSIGNFQFTQATLEDRKVELGKKSLEFEL